MHFRRPGPGSSVSAPRLPRPQHRLLSLARPQELLGHGGQLALRWKGSSGLRHGELGVWAGGRRGWTVSRWGQRAGACGSPHGLRP